MKPGTPHNAGSDSQLTGIQMLRGFAAMAVTFHHALQESLAASAGYKSPDFLTTSGAAGVDVFFVISGFIMIYTTFSLKREVRAPSEFLIDRFVRIYPIYWVFLGVLLAIWSVGFYKTLNPSSADVLRAVLLVPTDHLLLSVSWTLVYEVYFYLIFAATLFLRSLNATIVLTIAGIVVGLIVGGSMLDGASQRFFANPVTLEFCFGLVLGALVLKGATLTVPKWLAWGAAGMMLAAPAFLYHPSTSGLEGFPRVVAWGLPSLIVVAASLHWRSGPGKIDRLWRLLGDASYSIYLSHPFVMMVYGRLLRDHEWLSGLIQWPIVAVVTVLAAAVGVAVHRVIEQPLLAALRRVRRVARRPEPVTSAA